MLIDWLEMVKDSPDKFERIDDALKVYEQALKSSEPIDREQLMSRCGSPDEKAMLKLEMDLLDIFYSEVPVGFDGRFGDYIILNRVALGGFGVVTKAIGRDGQFVALKIAHLAWVVGMTRAEIEAEATLLKDLSSHPNIVNYVDSGWHENSWYIVTEWVDGGTLRDALQEVSFPLEQSISVALQICDALEFGHLQGVVHRDVKPANIMLSESRGKLHVTVLDYGVARKKEDRFTQHVKGSMKYIAPEQFDGHCDERGDVYALGIVLGELLATRFSRGQIPDPVARIQAKATARDPGRRYQSAAAMREDMLRVQKQIENGEITVVRSRRVGIAAGLVAALVLIISASVWSGFPFAKTAVPDKLQTVQQPAANWELCFNEQGQPEIRLETSPSGAHVTLYSMVEGEPDPDAGLRLGESPVQASIDPGEYLVVVEWPDGSWTEVLRRVPNIKMQDLMPTCPLNTFVQNGNTLQLGTVALPRFSEADMVEIDDQFFIDRQWLRLGTLECWRNTYGSLVMALEDSGKRPPFASELVAASDKVHSDGPEWTCSMVSQNEKVNADSPMWYNRYWAIEPGKPKNAFVYPDFTRELVCFRGVRSAKPFGSGGGR